MGFARGLYACNINASVAVGAALFPTARWFYDENGLAVRMINEENEVTNEYRVQQSYVMSKIIKHIT